MFKFLLIWALSSGLVNSQSRPGGGPDFDELPNKKIDKEIFMANLHVVTRATISNFSYCDIKQKRPYRFNIVEIYKLFNTLYFEDAVLKLTHTMKSPSECPVSKISCLLKGAEVEFHDFIYNVQTKSYLMTKYKINNEEADAIINFFKLVAPPHIKLGPVQTELSF